MSEYCSPVELARKYSVSVWTVRRWIKEGRIEGAEQVGKQWRIPMEYLTGEKKIGEKKDENTQNAQEEEGSFVVI